MHGLLSSSQDWVAYGENRSLPYFCVENGYDVWLGNFRGASGSVNHVFLNPRKDSAKFWDISWTELGVYDLTALIDFILEKTKHKKLFYIGHSQAGSSFFTMVSERPEYNRKIRLANVLATVSQLSHPTNKWIIAIASLWKALRNITRALGIYEVPATNILMSLGKTFCPSSNPVSDLCITFLFLFNGYDFQGQLPKDLLPDLFNNYPSSASLTQVIHLLQLFESRRWQKFDYGPTENFKRYGIQIPPLYDTSCATAPVAYHSTYDILSKKMSFYGLQRIVRGPNTHNEIPSKIKRPPILIVHPLAASAIDWIHYHGRDSLPYLLFEEGYDVWLGNVRGAGQSFNHISLDRYKDAEIFWNISFHDIGYYDHPAMIDYILNKTESEKLSYIGMSQGEASFLVLASTRPEYNEKIGLACLMGPSSHLKFSENNFYLTLGKYWSTLEKLFHVLRVHHLPVRDLFSLICPYQVFPSICEKMLNPIVGYANNDQYDLEIRTKLYRVYPTTFASKQLLHYLQVYNTGIFRRYDYGSAENFKLYGSTEPPEYDLKKVKVPVAYFWADNDCWTTPKDVEEVERKLPNMVLSYRVPLKTFSHVDFLLAKDAKKLVYDELVKTVEKYNS